MAPATACEDSRAGMIPSVWQRAAKPSIASASLTERYSARPVSFSQECSGPTPG